MQIIDESTGNRRNVFLNGPQPDMVLVDEVFTPSGTPSDILWLLQDHQNTVTDVATMASSGNSTATLVNHLEYNAFGTITSQTNSAYQPLQTYTGQIQDTATGLLYYDARWYDPGVAQFVSEDPIGFAAGDANLRRYVGNSMPNAVDPTGLEESGGGSFLASMINGVSPGFGYLLERQQKAETMIGEAAISKYENWKHHYIHGGRYRPGGIYGEYEGVAEAAAHMSLLGDSETMGLNIMRSGAFAYGFLLRREEEAAQTIADIPKSRAENAIDAAKNYGREQFFGCMLEDETVMRDLEAGNAVGQDKFQIAATIVSTLVLEPMFFARLGSILNWVRSTATFRRLASIPGLRYLDDAARLATKSQIDEGLEWVDGPNAKSPGQWVSKNESLGTGAEFQHKLVPGREGQTYRVPFQNKNPKGRPFVDFDDYEAARDALIDVKKSVVTSKKGLDQAQRQLQAAQQNGVKNVIWKVSNRAQKLRAEAFFRRKGITGIDVEVVQ